MVNHMIDIFTIVQTFGQVSCTLYGFSCVYKTSFSKLQSTLFTKFYGANHRNISIINFVSVQESSEEINRVVNSVHMFLIQIKEDDREVGLES